MRTVLITRDDAHLLQKVEAACRGGIDAVQLRDKQGAPRAIYDLALQLRTITWRYRALLFINSYPDIARAVDADGVHLPENHFSPTRMKTGMSVHSVQAALAAEQRGADFLFFSIRLDSLRSVTKQTSLPVYALGGITPGQVPALLEEGAYGIAAISALLDAPDVEAAARAFSSYFKKPPFSFKGVLGIISTLEMGIAAIQKGVDGIQFRHKGPFTRDVFHTAEALRALCVRANIPFFINDRIDIAQMLDAEGVHLGQTDLPIHEARRQLGPLKIIGATASNLQEAIRAEAEGADYIGLGAVFHTKSKVKTIPPIGIETVREVKEHIRIPLIAIGGIDQTNAASVFHAGADGIAVLSALLEVLNDV
jgi:thiamine-phosphate pyrophosphorylase